MWPLFLFKFFHANGICVLNSSTASSSGSLSLLCLHRMLCEKLWSKGIWIRSGRRSSGSLPVKPAASALLGPAAALWMSWLSDALVNTEPLLLLCPFTPRLRPNRKCKTCGFQMRCSLCRFFSLGFSQCHKTNVTLHINKKKKYCFYSNVRVSWTKGLLAERK